MGWIGNGGLGIPFRRGGGIDWTAKIPAELSITFLSDTLVKVDWTDGAETIDGIKVYFNDVLKDTISYGIGTAIIPGLIPETFYSIKLIAYIGESESNPIIIETTTLTKWYLAGGIALANCKLALKQAEAIDLADSYINLANPGTNNAVPVVAPLFNVALGWSFDGLTQYLTTGLAPVNNQTWSMIIKYSGFLTGADTILGLYETADKAFYMQLNTTGTKTVWVNGGTSGNHPYIAQLNRKGVLCFAGSKKYLNGAYVLGNGDLPAGAGAITYDIWIGQVHYSAPANFYDGFIQAIAVYDKVLGADEVLAISNRMVNIGEIFASLKTNFLTWGFGALICFTMNSFMDGRVPDTDPDNFNPTDLDIDEWLDACVAAGMEYVMLTVKEEDGFCLWPTAYFVLGNDPYSIESSSWYAAHGNPDIVDLFTTKCREHNLKVGIYFGVMDLTWEARTGNDETTDAAGYIAMVQMQLTELLSNYGKIDYLWLDSWYMRIQYQEIPFLTLYNHIKALQPNCIVSDNSHLFPTAGSEINIYEVENGDGNIPVDNTDTAEEIVTIRNDGLWYYKSTEDQSSGALKSAATINASVIQANARNGNYLLGISPDTTGHLPAAQKILLESL